jgi:hypothetical protein
MDCVAYILVLYTFSLSKVMAISLIWKVTFVRVFSSFLYLSVVVLSFTITTHLVTTVDWPIFEGVTVPFHLEYFMKSLKAQLLFIHFKRGIPQYFVCLHITIWIYAYSFCYGSLIGYFLKSYFPFRLSQSLMKECGEGDICPTNTMSICGKTCNKCIVRIFK